MNDLRTPVGLFFSLSGIILVVTGVATDNRAPLESANVDLYCGASVLAFGALMLWLAARRS